MLDINRTISVTGTSYIDVIENGNKVRRQIAYMNASIPKEGDFSINKSIQERDLFDTYSGDVIADFAEFERYVYELSKGMKNE